MDVRAHAGVFRWRGGLRAAEESLVSSEALEQLTALPHDVEGGADHPEGMCRFDDGGPEHRLLVAYDSPSTSRVDSHGVTADVFRLTAAGPLERIAEALASLVGRDGEGEG